MGPNPPVNGDTSIFNISKGAILIVGEARNGRWSIGGEFKYLMCWYKPAINGDLASALPVGSATWMLNFKMDVN